MKSELTFQLMVESSPNAIILVNKEGKIAYVNAQTENLFNYSKQELLGEQVEKLIPERFREHHPGFMGQYYKAPSVRNMGAGRELFALRKDGTEFPIEIGLNPLVTVEGTLILASIIDITERKKAEERFRVVVESAPNAMVVVNSEGIINLVNNQTEKLFGYSRRELIGNAIEILLPDRYKSAHPGHRNGFFNSPSVRSMGAGRDLFALHKDGTEVPVEIGLNPIETEEGNMVLASIIDITQRKEQEATIQHQMKELELKNTDLEQFAYIASHDLQEPLRTISNFVKMLIKDYGTQLDERAGIYLTAIEESTGRTKILVKALLDYSRLGRKEKDVSIDCQKLVNEVLADLQQLILKTDSTFHVGKLPTITGHVTEMRQLFQNLISNAIKFRQKDLSPVIHINCQDQNGDWLFSVADNGIGIEDKYIGRIFNIFQRLHSSDDYEGYGIGLANCKKIVEIHGGRIWVESSKNAGSTFYFNIPKR